MQKSPYIALFSFLVLFLFTVAYAQAQTTKSPLSIKTDARQASKSSPAMFPGGEAAYSAYIEHHLKFTEQARENDISGFVTISFIITETGTIEAPKIIRDIGGGCGKKALEMVKNMPPWIAAKSNGKPVKSLMELQFKFKIMY